MSPAGNALCPSCREPLQLASSRFHVLACAHCGGVWADAATSRRIVSEVDRELVRLATKVGVQADREPAPRVTLVDQRPCPVCARTLSAVRAAGVTVDVCPEHGTWFDRDELGRLSRNLAYERASLPDGAAPVQPGAKILLSLLEGDEA